MSSRLSGFIVAFFGVFLVFGSSVSAYTKSDVLISDIKLVTDCSDKLFQNCVTEQKVLVLYKTKDLAPDTVISENTEKINGTTYKIYQGQPYYKEIDGKFYETAYDVKTISDYEKLVKNDLWDWLKFKIALAADYFASSEDGLWLGQGTVFSSARSDTTAAGGQFKTGTYQVCQASVSGGTYYLGRCGFPFNTSTIEDSTSTTTVTVMEAILNFYSQAAEVGTYVGTVVDWSPASYTSIVADDYNNFSFSSLGTTDGTFSATVKESVSLATTTSIIDTTGYSAFLMLDDNDFSSTTPTALDQLPIYFSEQAGTGYDPYLTVTISTSTVVSETSISTSTTTVSVAQGDVIFSLAIVSFLLCFIFLGLVFNSFLK